MVRTPAATIAALAARMGLGFTRRDVLPSDLKPSKGGTRNKYAPLPGHGPGAAARRLKAMRRLADRRAPRLSLAV
jgi:hypothetical protein